MSDAMSSILVLTVECESASLQCGRDSMLRLLHQCATSYANTEECFQAFRESFRQLSGVEKKQLTVENLMKNFSVFEIFLKAFKNDYLLYVDYALLKFTKGRTVDLRGLM